MANRDNLEIRKSGCRPRAPPPRLLQHSEFDIHAPEGRLPIGRSFSPCIREKQELRPGGTYEAKLAVSPRTALRQSLEKPDPTTPASYFEHIPC